MSDEAWTRLKGAYQHMLSDHGPDGDVIKDCYLIEDPKKAEEFTQMKGCVGAVVHPSAQVWVGIAVRIIQDGTNLTSSWPYKFVHALLRIVEETGNLNIQANTPVGKVSEKDANGWITVETLRGTVRTKAVFHATVSRTPSVEWNAAELITESMGIPSTSRVQ
jgi:glycine/D-amino acid oxidase-like deaminating enzyme